LEATKKYFTFSIYVAVVFIILIFGFRVEASDKENCLMCHKYRFIGRIDANGKKINYNVDEHMYSKSVHRNVSCRDCHTNIKKLPHDPVTEEVNCANQCHIKPPFAEEKFSHKKIIDSYNQSVHGIKSEDAPELKKAKPDCKFCHLNPIYTRVDESRIAYEETLARCKNCHQKEGATQAYKHITHRLRHKTSRSPQEIVLLCSKCHQDAELMKTLNVKDAGLTAVETYNHSIHGKAVALGSQVAADCISCHASNALHDIYKKDHGSATVNKDNLKITCKQCHEKTNDRFVEIAVHSRIDRNEKPLLFFAGFGLKLALFATVFGLMSLLSLETHARKKNGMKWQIKRGSTWRGKSKR
jgi:hypothetical protein